MPSILPSILALLSGVVFLGLASGLLFALLGIRMAAADTSAVMIGVVGSAYFAGLLAGSVSCDQVIRRVGHIRAFSVFAAVSAIAALLHVLIPPVGVWAVLRAAMGFSMAGLFMVSESWLHAKAMNETRGRTFALFAVAHSGGVGAGPLLINVADPASYELFLVASILFSIALLPVALTRVGNPELSESGRFGFRELFAISPVAVVGVFAMGLVGSGFYGLGAVFGEGIGLTTAATSLFMTVTVLGGFLMQYPIGAMSDRLDRRHVMIGLSLVAGTAAVSISLSGAAVPAALLMLAVVYGGASQPMYGLAVAHANDYVEPHDFVAASAGLLFAYGVGASIGPFVASAGMAWLGPPGLFAFLAVVLLAFGGFVGFRMRLREPIPMAEQGEFIVVPRMTPTAAALDPRAPADEPEEPAAEAERD
jgi:MFS family permease